MALDLDGFAALRSIGSNPRAFSNIALEAGKTARLLVLKQLKAKESNARVLRDVRKALGSEQFGLLLDGLGEREVKTLVGKCDKYHPELKDSDARWRLQHLRGLAEGVFEPADNPTAAPKRATIRKATKRKASDPDRLSSKAMGAVRKR